MACRLQRKTFADGTHDDYTYDAHGNMITASATDAAGVTTTTTMQYDGLDRLTGISYPNGTALTFQYDGANRRTQMMDQSGFTLKYAYDFLGRLAALTDGSGNLVVRYTYDTLGRLARADQGNGDFTTYQYDAAGELTLLVNNSAAGAVLSRFAYTYDQLGRPVSETTLDGTFLYGYDADGQLTSVQTPDGRTINYRYDANGNRVATTDAATTTPYTTNALNEYTQVGAATYAYDRNGNLVARTDASGTTTYRYDQAGQLVSVQTPTDSIRYLYDAVGVRIGQVDNGVTTNYLVDPAGDGDLVAEYDAGGNTITHFTYANGLVSQVAPSGAAAYYGFDATGNTAELADASGAVLDRYAYLPFGEQIGAGGTTANPFTYGGQDGVRDTGLGTYLTRTRLYDPALGRFLSPDPVSFLGGDTNLYRYVGNSPVLQADPMGTQPRVEFSNAEQVNGFIEVFGIAHIVASARAEPLHDFHETLLTNTQAIQDIQNGTASPLTIKLLPYGLQSLDRQAKALNDEGITEIQLSNGPINVRDAADAVIAAGKDLAPASPDPVLGADLASSGQANAFEPPPGAPAPIPAPLPTGTGNAFTNLVKQNGGSLKKGGAFLGAATNLLHPTVGTWSAYVFQSPANINPFPSGVNPPHGNPQVKNKTDAAQGFASHVICDVLVGGLAAAGAAALVTTAAIPPLGLAGLLIVGLTSAATIAICWSLIHPVSHDPNEIVGPAGVGDGRFVDVQQSLAYTVAYQNQPSATAPAQVVKITEQLDPNLDFRTFQFGDLGFGPFHVTVPAGLTNFSTRVDATATLGVFVDVRANLDVATGLATWTLTAIDPTTLDVPLDNPLVGFLPPDDSTGRGEGFVTYTVQPRAGSASGTVINAKATIVFDRNAPIDTAPTFNTIDAGAPASTVAPLPATTAGASFTVSWSGQDEPGGSGINDFDVFVSDNGGPFTPWLLNTRQTSSTFTGQPGHTYGFFSVATDNVGNVQPPPAAAQANTTVAVSAAPPAFVYDPASRVLTITAAGPGSAFAFAQQTTADAAGLHTTYTFSLNGQVQSYTDAQLGQVIVQGLAGGDSASLVTDDNYAAAGGSTAATTEAVVIGDGFALVEKVDAAGNATTFLSLGGFQEVDAALGREDYGAIVGTPSIENTFVSAGGYAYMSSGTAFYYSAAGGRSTPTPPRAPTPRTTTTAPGRAPSSPAARRTA